MNKEAIREIEEEIIWYGVGKKTSKCLLDLVKSGYCFSGHETGIDGEIISISYKDWDISFNLDTKSHPVSIIDFSKDCDLIWSGSLGEGYKKAKAYIHPEL